MSIIALQGFYAAISTDAALISSRRLYRGARTYAPIAAKIKADAPFGERSAFTLSQNFRTYWVLDAPTLTETTGPGQAPFFSKFRRLTRLLRSFTAVVGRCQLLANERRSLMLDLITAVSEVSYG